MYICVCVRVYECGCGLDKIFAAIGALRAVQQCCSMLHINCALRDSHSNQKHLFLPARSVFDARENVCRRTLASKRK